MVACFCNGHTGSYPSLLYLLYVTGTWEDNYIDRPYPRGDASAVQVQVPLISLEIQRHAGRRNVCGLPQKHYSAMGR
jgi:hypothetical protein